MAKRFTETKIWDDPWYHKLPIAWKCVWRYICDKCDEAGIWNCNFELAEFQIGTKIKWDGAEAFLNKDKQCIEIHSRFWIIKEFLPFQYGDTSGKKYAKIRQMLNALPDNILDKKNL